MFSANRQTVLFKAATAGFGAENMPTSLIDAPMRSGRLVRIPPALSSSPVAMTALWQKNRITTQLVMAPDTYAQMFHSSL